MGQVLIPTVRSWDNLLSFLPLPEATEDIFLLLLKALLWWEHVWNDSIAAGLSLSASRAVEEYTALALVQ